MLIQDVYNANLGLLNKDEYDFICFLYQNTPDGSATARTKNIDNSLGLDFLKKIAQLRGLNYIPKICPTTKGKYDIDYNPQAISILSDCLQTLRRNTPSSEEGGYCAPAYPLLFRKAVFFIVYMTMYVANEEKVCTLDTLKNTGLQKKILTEINVTKKVFQSWGLYPERNFFSTMREPVNIKLARGGKKNMDLLFMLTCLVDFCLPTRFIDVFGGTGTVSANQSDIEIKVLNEYDKFTLNFLLCVKHNAVRVIEESRKIYYNMLDEYCKEKNANSEFYIAAVERMNKKIRQSNIPDRIFGEAFFTCTYKMLHLGGFYYKDKKYISGASAILKLETIENRQDDVTKSLTNATESTRFYLAAMWYYLHSFKGAGSKVEPDIANCDIEQLGVWLKAIGLQDDTDKYWFMHTKYCKATDSYQYASTVEASEITPSFPLVKYGDYLRTVHLRNQDFRELLKEADSYVVKSKEPSSGKQRKNIYEDIFDYTEVKGWELLDSIEDISDKRSIIAKPSQTVVYLDPPYFLTKQYADRFSDYYHRLMIEWMRKTECKWIFSCKDKITNQDEAEKPKRYRYISKDKSLDENWLIRDFNEYFLGLYYGLIPDAQNRCYIADRSNQPKELYVYRLVGEDSSEIMITNFKAPAMSRRAFILYWQKSYANDPDKAKAERADTLEADAHFYECRTYKEFLKDLGIL